MLRRGRYIVSSAPHDKLVNDARPGGLFGPERQRLVLESLVRKLECLVPHVLIDGSLPVLVEEPLPRGEPIDPLGRPRTARGVEHHLPVYQSVLDRESLLVGLLSGNKCVPVHSLEVGRVARKLRNAVPDMLFVSGRGGGYSVVSLSQLLKSDIISVFTARARKPGHTL